MFHESSVATRYPVVERAQPGARALDNDPPPGEFFAVLWRRRPWIMLGMLAGLLGAVAFLTLVTPRYTSVAQLLIDPNDLRVVDNAVTSSSTPSDANTAYVESEARVLSSDKVLLKVIETQRLDRDPEFVEPPSLVRLVREFIADALGLAPVAPRDPVVTALQTFAPLVIARRQEKTYVVDLSVTTRDPVKSTVLANAIVKAYLDDQAGRRTAAAKRATDALSGRLQELRDRVRDAENRSQAYKAEHHIVAASGQLVNEQQLTEFANQLTLASARADEAKARLDQIERVRRGDADPSAITEAVQSPTISALRSQQADVLRRRAELAARLGERHPSIVDINAQARDLQEQINREIARLATAARGDYDRALATRDALTQKLDELKQESVVTGQALVRLRELEREVEASRAVYQAYLVRSRETSEQERVNTANVRVLAEANVPNKRAWPPRAIFVLGAAFAFGALAGGGLAFLRDWTDDRIHSRRDFEAACALPIIAEIPNLDDELAGKSFAARLRAWHRGAGPMATLVDAPRSRFAAAIHRLRYVVGAQVASDTPQTILFLSAGVAGARSEVALNFALSAAINQPRVLLVDADLAGRGLSDRLAGGDRLGLLDVAEDRAKLETALVAGPRAGLTILPAGRSAGAGDPPANPEAILRVLDRARADHLVVVDAPGDRLDPVSSALSASASFAALVVTAGLTRARDIAEFQRSTDFLAGKVGGVVFVSRHGGTL